ncbi:hypothetical protein [Rhizobium sp.]
MTIQHSIGAVDGETPSGGVWPFWRYFAVLVVAAAGVIGFDLLDGIPFSRDVDDVLRELQIRRLVEGAGWFDLSLPAVQMPETYILPWSRLVDLPYALIAWTLQPVIGQELALAVAFRLWPPVLGILNLLALLGCLRRIVPQMRDLSPALLFAIPVFALYSIWEFSPDRIDHHNVQILMLTLLVYGVLRWDGLGGCIVGVASSLSLVVGLETLPVLAGVLGAMSIAWLMDSAGSGPVLRAVGATCAILTLALMAALVAPSHYLLAVTDSFSAPYAAAMVGFGFIALMSTTASFPRRSRGHRCLVFIGAHLLLLAAIVWAYPVMLRGPMPMLDGLAKTYWFDRINFEQGVLSLFSSGDMRSVLQYLAIVAIMLGALPPVIRAMRQGEAALPVAYIAIAATVVMACISVRFLRISLGAVAILLPVALVYFRGQGGFRASRVPLAGGLAIIVLLAVARMYLVPPQQVRYDAFDYVVRGDCGKVGPSTLHGVQAGRIMTTPRLGIEIAYLRPTGVSVSTIPFHRASAAMSDMFTVMMAKTAAENAGILGSFDYLAFCTLPPGVPNADRLPLLQELQAGKSVAGLQPITGDGPVRIFRIDHAALK